MAEHFGRRGLLVLISDLYEDPEAVLEAVAPLRFRGNDIIVFHVLDPAEIEFSFDDAVGVRGPRERRADPGRAGGARRAVPRAGAGAHRRRCSERFSGNRDRLRAAQHVDAARPRAVQLSVDARAADEGSLIAMAFLDAAVPRSGSPPSPSRCSST